MTFLDKPSNLRVSKLVGRHPLLVAGAVSTGPVACRQNAQVLVVARMATLCVLAFANSPILLICGLCTVAVWGSAVWIMELWEPQTLEGILRRELNFRHHIAELTVPLGRCGQVVWKTTLIGILGLGESRCKSWERLGILEECACNLGMKVRLQSPTSTCVVPAQIASQQS